LVAAIATALLWLAPFYAHPRHQVRLSAATEAFISRLTHNTQPLRQSRYVAAVIATLALLLLVSGGKLNFDDNIRSLNSSPPSLLAQEQKVQQLMGYSSYPRYITITGDNEQAVLADMAKVTDKLNATASQQQLKVQSLSTWIPTIAQQQQQKNQLKTFIDNGDLATMQSYIDSARWLLVTLQLEQHISPKDWPEDLAILAPPLFSQDDKSYGMISYYAQLTEQQRQAISNSMDNIAFFDQPQRLSNTLASVRVSLLWFFALAAAAFALILVSRYGFKYGLLATCTPVFAALGSLLVSQLVAGGLSIFNLLACLLIVALAVDYIVFFNEQGHKKHVVLAILLSALSSVAAFGMMMFSQTPAVFHFGLSTFIGILLALVLAFITPLKSPSLTKRKDDDHTV
ncbi:MAG: putative exporter, partial [Phenylobacterium sp.]